MYEDEPDGPPCDGCQDKPPTLYPSNELPWQVWSLLNEFDRPLAVGMAVIPLPIPSEKMLHMVAAQGGSEEDFRRVCIVERTMYPHVRAQYDAKK